MNWSRKHPTSANFIIFTFVDCGFHWKPGFMLFLKKVLCDPWPTPSLTAADSHMKSILQNFALLRWYKAKNLKHKEYLTFCTGKERYKSASKGILTDRWCAARCDASPMAMHLNSNLEIRHNLPNHPGLPGRSTYWIWVSLLCNTECITVLLHLHCSLFSGILSAALCLT